MQLNSMKRIHNWQIKNGLIFTFLDGKNDSSRLLAITVLSSKEINTNKPSLTSPTYQNRPFPSSSNNPIVISPPPPQSHPSRDSSSPKSSQNTPWLKRVKQQKKSTPATPTPPIQYTPQNWQQHAVLKKYTEAKNDDSF